MPRIKRHPSFQLCRELAGAHPDGNVGDQADIIAQALECAEEASGDLPPDPPTLADAHRAIQRIRSVLDHAERRLRELAS